MFQAHNFTRFKHTNTPSIISGRNLWGFWRESILLAVLILMSLIFAQLTVVTTVTPVSHTVT